MTAYKFNLKDPKKWMSIQTALSINDTPILSKEGITVKVNIPDKTALGNLKRNKAMHGIKLEKVK